MAECIFNQTNIYKNGAVDQAAALAYVRNNIGQNNQVFLPVYTNAIQNCTADFAANKDKFSLKMKKIVEKGKLRCNPTPAFMMGCFHQKIFTNCPAQKWTASK